MAKSYRMLVQYDRRTSTFSMAVFGIENNGKVNSQSGLSYNQLRRQLDKYPFPHVILEVQPSNMRSKVLDAYRH